MGKNSNQINLKLTDEQREILASLVGIMGGTEAEAMRNVFLAWLSDNKILTEKIRSRLNKNEQSKTKNI